jgi:formylglycine-generating enzyme required for sulfatase activity
VPGGTITIGGTDDDAKPAFEIELGSFYLSKAPISNLQFEAFDAEFRRSPGTTDDDPAVGVSFHAATAYCAWYAGVARKPIRLPTEVEWEYACRGGQAGRCFFGDASADAEGYVWDGSNSGGRLRRFADKKTNPFGLLGMLGGVWEWTSSLAKPYPAVAGDGRDAPAAPGPRVLRGGSFRSSRESIGCGVRRACDPGAVHDDVGFRILREFPGGS